MLLLKLSLVLKLMKCLIKFQMSYPLLEKIWILIKEIYITNHNIGSIEWTLIVNYITITFSFYLWALIKNSF